MKLRRNFYTHRDACDAAIDLLGKVLVTNGPGGRTAGIITETEAYTGVRDRASHAFGGKRTARNASMYARGGTAYVYLCYGIHKLFNVVVQGIDVPEAVLIRATHPVEGIDTMVRRRPLARSSTGGPGTLTQALGITLDDDGVDLTKDRIWIEDIGKTVDRERIIRGPRIGVGYAGPDALLPYRFRIAPSPTDHQ